MATITINGTLTFDESAGLQVSGVPSGQEDNNDNDLALSGLSSAVQTRLFTGLGLSNTFATADGIAKSADNFISVSGGTVTSLGFVDGNGAPLPVLGGGQAGVLTSLTAVDGGAISLFGDASLGNRLALGVDTDGNIVFAVFLDPNAALSAAKVWVVQFEPISHPDATNADDAVNLLDNLGVAASSNIEFNFNALPSGSNLFGVVGTTESGLVVIGQHPALSADGTYTNASDVIHTSQGGGPTTIGVNNQMFDPGDAAYFTFVKNPVPNFLSGAPGGLDPTEADDADNIQYTGGTLEVSGGFTRISQIQGNQLAAMQIQCFNMGDAPQGQDFVDDGLGTGSAAPITAVRVFNAAGTKIEDSSLPGAQDPNVTITITNGIATVTGLNANYRIEWDTTGTLHDQVLITGTGGKFDIGGFGVTEVASTSVDIGDKIRFEDSGPKIGPIANSIVDFANGSTATKTLDGAVGTDPNAAPYIIDSFTTDVTAGDVPLKGVVSNNNQVVTYFADTNGDSTFGNTGDTPYYRLTLNETGAGTYTFDVLVSPPPALVEFNFNALPSGSNLFGVVGTTESGLVVIGQHPALSADGTYTNASDVIHTSQGGGPTTIGVNNQMFDPGDAAYFTFVKNPVPNFLSGAPGGLDPTEADDADNIQYTGGTLEVSGGFTRISQIQGNQLAAMQIQCFNMGDAPQGQDFVDDGLGTGSAAPITAVRVFNAAGTKIEDSSLPGAQDPNVTITITNGIATVTGLNANYRIEWDTTGTLHDQVLITGTGGKFDIGGFGALQASPTPDQVLNFVAKATDGDSDSSTAAFSVGIDGTGIFDDGVVGGVSVNSALVDVLGTAQMEQSVV